MSAWRNDQHRDKTVVEKDENSDYDYYSYNSESSNQNTDYDYYSYQSSVSVDSAKDSDKTVDMEPRNHTLGRSVMDIEEEILEMQRLNASAVYARLADSTTSKEYLAQNIGTHTFGRPISPMGVQSNTGSDRPSHISSYMKPIVSDNRDRSKPGSDEAIGPTGVQQSAPGARGKTIEDQSPERSGSKNNGYIPITKRTKGTRQNINQKERITEMNDKLTPTATINPVKNSHQALVSGQHEISNSRQMKTLGRGIQKSRRKNSSNFGDTAVSTDLLDETQPATVTAGITDTVLAQRNFHVPFSNQPVKRGLRRHRDQKAQSMTGLLGDPDRLEDASATGFDLQENLFEGAKITSTRNNSISLMDPRGRSALSRLVCDFEILCEISNYQDHCHSFC